MGERRDGFDGGTHNDLLAGADAAFDAAVSICCVAPGESIPPVNGEDDIVDLGAALPGAIEASAETNRLERVDAANRLSYPPVELAVPVDVAAQPHGQPADSHFYFAADGVSVGLCCIDGFYHSLAGSGISRAHWICLDSIPIDHVRGGRADATNGQCVAMEGDAEFGEKTLGNSASSNSGGGLAGTGAFEDVADVIESVLDGARQVRMAGPHAGDALDFDLGIDRPGCHLHGPVHPVAILDPEGDRGAKSEPVANATSNLGMVFFDLHAAAATVATLAARKVRGDVIFRQR